MKNFFSIAMNVYVCASLFKGGDHDSSSYIAVLVWNSLEVEQENAVWPYDIGSPAGIQIEGPPSLCLNWKAFSLHTLILEEDVLYHKVALLFSFQLFMPRLHFIFQSARKWKQKMYFRKGKNISVSNIKLLSETLSAFSLALPTLSHFYLMCWVLSRE